MSGLKSVRLKIRELRGLIAAETKKQRRMQLKYKLYQILQMLPADEQLEIMEELSDQTGEDHGPG